MAASARTPYDGGGSDSSKAAAQEWVELGE